MCGVVKLREGYRYFMPGQILDYYLAKQVSSAYRPAALPPNERVASNQSMAKPASLAPNTAF